VPTSKAWDKIKDKADPQPKHKSKMKVISNEDLRVDYFPKIYSKLGGYTHPMKFRVLQDEMPTSKARARNKVSVCE
jgi:hypothetical protein